MAIINEGAASRIEKQAIKAKKAAKRMRVITETEKNDALYALAGNLEKNMDLILVENKKDTDAGQKKGYDAAYIDRLSLDEDRVADFAKSLREVAELEDPVGETLSSRVRLRTD